MNVPKLLYVWTSRHGYWLIKLLRMRGLLKNGTGRGRHWLDDHKEFKDCREIAKDLWRTLGEKFWPALGNGTKKG